MWNPDKQYDVVVAGAGPAGIAAAIASARNGARTLVVEQSSRPGGVAVGCACPAFMGCAVEGRQLVSGIGEELVRRLGRRNAAMLKRTFRRDFADGPILEDIVSSEDEIALEANRMLAESGADLLAYCTVYGCAMERRNIARLDAFCAGENLRLTAKMFVDCTGDALLAHLGGLPVNLTPADALMTKTVMIRVRNLKPFVVAEMKQRFQNVRQTFPFPAQDAFMLHPSGLHGDFLLNVTLTGGDSFSPGDLTRMDCELREQIPVILDWLRKNIPEFQDCILEAAAPRLGVRNGRNIVGRETIRCQDLDEGTPVADPVAVGTRHYGGHGTTNFTQNWAKMTDGFRSVPYGTLLSPECDNYVAGGRAIGVEPRAVTSIRMMAQCFATGQAAGTIAALAAMGGAFPAYERLRQSLMDQGLLLQIGE
ncbi:MAG: FAD-dependent oxidoreductase [Victivallales bacterium]|nr:FAD-dependent oxidoreductase [Victivallales bacterium]